MHRSVRSTLWVCLAALLIHLIPLWLPSNVLKQELAIARAMGDPRRRLEVLKPLKEHPKATAAELREAAELLWPAVPLEAHELALEAERREPGAVETQLLLARICHGERMRRCEEAALARAEQLAPGDPRPDLLRADFQERAGQREAALESLERAYEKAPGELEVGVRYGRLLSASGRHAAAEELLMGLAPRLGRMRTLLELGRLRVREGRLEEAWALFAKVVEDEPKLVEGYYELGMVSFGAGDLEGAMAALKAAARLDVSDMRSMAALCWLQREAGLLEEWRVTRMDLERRFPERMDAVRDACR
jgi:tetratricopeptide (TPR) repeat protein